MKLLYYCLGGGFGHFTRFAAFCHTTSLQPELITANSEIAGCGLLNDLKIHSPENDDLKSKESFALWLEKVICASGAARIFIDAFPGGILGELAGLKVLQRCETVYLARILQWQKYLRRIDGELPEFNEVFLLENLKPEQMNYIESLKCRVSRLKLTDPPGPEISDLPSGFWLIIHSECNDELLQLWKFALETAEIEGCSPFFVVVSPHSRPDFLPKTVLHLNLYPAYSLFSQAAKVFSAAGFNMVRQMSPFRGNHYLLPFARSLDDQFFRISELKQERAPRFGSSFLSDKYSP